MDTGVIQKLTSVCSIFNLPNTDKIFSDSEKYIEKRFYEFTPSVDEGAGNFIKQGYLYLKCLPEYIDANDI
ncbi:hypothetical protein N752_00080 [Desulforamulus aquiferis]|nr:hypothetical protein [Desulforamulus aquiferis]RYD07011.1 hypothetical protein N752_00080 [Desulforamulus aquiferis]